MIRKGTDVNHEPDDCRKTAAYVDVFGCPKHDRRAMPTPFGTRLKAIRLAAGIGTNEFDRILGKDRTGFTSRVESEERYPRLNTVIEVARALNVSVGYLVGDEATEGEEGSPQLREVLAQAQAGEYTQLAVDLVSKWSKRPGRNLSAAGYRQFLAGVSLAERSADMMANAAPPPPRAHIVTRAEPTPVTGVPTLIDPSDVTAESGARPIARRPEGQVIVRPPKKPAQR